MLFPSCAGTSGQPRTCPSRLRSLRQYSIRGALLGATGASTLMKISVNMMPKSSASAV